MVEKGDVIKIDYTLTVEGETVDTSEGREPLEITVGSGQVIPGFEKELIGMKEGEEKSFTVAPDQGYGAVSEEAFVEIPKEKLASDVEPEVGMVLTVGSPDGRTHRAKIHEVKEETLVLDFNHPLAGKQLDFDVKVVNVK